MTRRAIVVGAGAIGIASAYFLSRDGWRVTVVDRSEVARGCSYGNACLIVPSHSHPIPGPGVIGQALRWMLRSDSPFYVRPRLVAHLAGWTLEFRRHCNRQAVERGFRALLALSRESIELYEELLHHGEADFFFERRGVVNAYLSEAGFAGAEAEAAELEAHGFSVKLLPRQPTLELEPALSPKVVGSLFVDGEAHGFSYRYVTSLAASVERRQGRILTGRSVARLVVSNGRIVGVRLEDGEELEADLIVLSAGAWSGRLLTPLGVALPLQPAKGYSATVDRFPGGPRLPILVHERRMIVTPLADRIRFGGTLELAGFDLKIDRARYAAVIRGAREVLAADFPMDHEEAWCGLRPVTPDGLPVIDRVSGLEGLIVACGHAMLGFTQSPATGKLVAQIASGETPSVSLEPFRLSRFGRGWKAGAAL